MNRGLVFSKLVLDFQSKLMPVNLYFILTVLQMSDFSNITVFKYKIGIFINAKKRKKERKKIAEDKTVSKQDSFGSSCIHVAIVHILVSSRENVFPLQCFSSEIQKGSFTDLLFGCHVISIYKTLIENIIIFVHHMIASVDYKLLI